MSDSHPWSTINAHSHDERWRARTEASEFNTTYKKVPDIISQSTSLGAVVDAAHQVKWTFHHIHTTQDVREPSNETYKSHS